MNTAFRVIGAGNKEIGCPTAIGITIKHFLRHSFKSAQFVLRFFLRGMRLRAIPDYALNPFAGHTTGAILSSLGIGPP